MNHILIVCDVEHGHFTSDPKEYWDIREKLDKKYGKHNYYTHMNTDDQTKIVVIYDGYQGQLQEFDEVYDIRSKKSK